MATTMKEYPAFYIFKRTDAPPSKHLMIYSHGLRDKGITGLGINKFSVPTKKRVHFYIPDKHILMMSKGTIEDAFRGTYRDEELIRGDKTSVDYELTKQAGTHQIQVNARQTYTDLTQYVDASDHTAGAAAPKTQDGLGLGVKCDILSIRAREFLGSTKLSLLLMLDELRQYEDIHCFFCRAKDAQSPPRGPRN